MNKPKAVCAKCRKPIKNNPDNVRHYVKHYENNDRVAVFELCYDCMGELYVSLFPELTESEDGE